MAIFEVDVRAAGLLSGLRNAEKRMAFAVVNALNRTAREIQAAERKKIEATLTVRKKEFILRQAAVIKPFASVKKGIMSATISVGAKPRLLLAAFEEGENREGQKALRSLGESGVAVPVIGGARRTKRSIVPEELWISKLKLKAHPRVGPRPPKGQDGPQPRISGLLRTYLVRRVGIFQRFGKSATRLLWAFVPQVSKAKKFEFIKTAQKIADQRFVANLQDEVAKTLKFAFGKGLK